MQDPQPNDKYHVGSYGNVLKIVLHKTNNSPANIKATLDVKACWKHEQITTTGAITTSTTTPRGKR